MTTYIVIDLQTGATVQTVTRADERKARHAARKAATSNTAPFDTAFGQRSKHT